MASLVKYQIYLILFEYASLLGWFGTCSRYLCTVSPCFDRSASSNHLSATVCYEFTLLCLKCPGAITTITIAASSTAATIIIIFVNYHYYFFCFTVWGYDRSTTKKSYSTHYTISSAKEMFWFGT